MYIYTRIRWCIFLYFSASCTQNCILFIFEKKKNIYIYNLLKLQNKWQEPQERLRILSWKSEIIKPETLSFSLFLTNWWLFFISSANEFARCVSLPSVSFVIDVIQWWMRVGTISDPRSRGIGEIGQHLRSDKISIRSRRAWIYIAAERTRRGER
jgi:hypothetical protein